MGKVTSVAGHLGRDEILKRIKSTVGFWKVQKWLVIWNAIVDPRPAEQIALHTGLAKQTVHNLISSYNRHGAAAVEGPGKGGRRRENMTFEEESDFLGLFKAKALTGQIATASEIHTALEKHLARKVHLTSVYRMLKRQGWKKQTPRPFHVQSKEGEQKEFKKNFQK